MPLLPGAEVCLVKLLTNCEENEHPSRYRCQRCMLRDRCGVHAVRVNSYEQLHIMPFSEPPRINVVYSMIQSRSEVRILPLAIQKN